MSTRITRSWWPDGRALICARLRCDRCRRLSGPFVLGFGAGLEAELARLTIRCRRRGWRRRTDRTADGQPVRADYCRGCARARRGST